MTVRERILAIQLMEMQERKPECIERLGIKVEMVDKNEENHKVEKEG